MIISWETGKQAYLEDIQNQTRMFESMYGIAGVANALKA